MFFMVSQTIMGLFIFALLGKKEIEGAAGSRERGWRPSTPTHKKGTPQAAHHDYADRLPHYGRDAVHPAIKK